MTYSQLLLLFVVLPIIALAVAVLRNHSQRRGPFAAPSGGQPFVVLVILVLVALLYTIPWDNHLIALNVWWYRRDLISGVTLGYIPLEEVVFFPLQTLLVGLWFLFLAPRLAHTDQAADGFHAHEQESMRAEGKNARIRWTALALGVCLWLLALGALRSGWEPGTYIGWELAWALPPLMLQFAFGGDILWKYRRLLTLTIVPMALYLCVVDAVAIRGGIWTIDQRQTLDVVLGVPLEEILFYTLTSTLVVFGLTLGVASESKLRLQTYSRQLALSQKKQ